jgi:hypothetical protein
MNLLGASDRTSEDDFELYTEVVMTEVFEAYFEVISRNLTGWTGTMYEKSL